MGMDLFQSRRNYNEPCRWWTRREEDGYDSDEIIMQRVPSGKFDAKEVTAEQNQHNIIGDTFMVDRTSVTIKTPDDVYGLKDNDLVEYQGEKWLVQSVQKGKFRSQSTLFATDKNCSHFWYIELRK